VAVDAGLFAVELWLVAFAGGALGAVVGGYVAYGLAGVTVALGELVRLASGQGPSPLVADPVVLDLATFVGYGPLLGPHVAFAGGVAGAAYAGRRGVFDPAFAYHPAKDLASIPGPRPRIAAVGGVFGVLGFLLAQLSVALGLPWDPVAASVVATGLVARVAFGYPLVGSAEGSRLDAPDEPVDRRDESGGSPDQNGGPERAGDDDRQPPTMADRPDVEPWLPWQSEPATVAALGALAGLGGALLAVATGSYMLAFGFPAAALLLFATDVDRVPVVHHMAFPAALAAASLPTAGVAVAAAVGMVFGVLGGLVGELAGRTLYAHADTHVDPPSVAIVVTTALVALGGLLGVFESAAVQPL
jgi:hypothetical protein